MAEPYVIEAKSVSKKFKIYLDRGQNLRDHALTRHRGRYEDRVVLQDISFSVRRGEALGLIGENGSGKSTMLKLLTGIMYPDSGSVVMDGRVSALIELGAGFHPDMTGRENIYTNAAIFGLSRREIDARLDDIIAFSELGAYIDNPVRTYSSGMYMRLAFSVAINVDADILLVDEILAVGDAAFQAKCFNRMREIKAKGTTIVLVSHSMGQVEQICDRCIWINQGHIEAEGKPREVTPQYLEYMATKNGSELYTVPAEPDTAPEAAAPQEEAPPVEDAPDAPGSPQEETNAQGAHFGNKKITLEKVALLDEDGNETDVLRTGRPFTIRAEYQMHGEVASPYFGIAIYRADGVRCYGINTRLDDISWTPAQQGSISIRIENCALLAETYLLDVAVTEQDDFNCDYWQNALSFRIVSDSREVGVASLPHSWEIKEGSSIPCNTDRQTY